MVQSTPFNPVSDLAPIPFDLNHCLLAKQLKQKGLLWTPHVGCFVWDPEESIKVKSPFPERIYFILNLNHFLKLLGTTENMQKVLVWLPTWHQARLLCEKFSLDNFLLTTAYHKGCSAKQELIEIYKILLDGLGNE